MKFLTILTYFIGIYAFLKLAIFLLSKLNGDLASAIFQRRLEQGILSMQDLYKFGFDKFLKLSEVYLEDLGMTNISNAYLGYEGVDFACEFRNEKVYVQCILEDLSDMENSDKEISSVGSPEVQKLLGQMVHDGVKFGIIITNGCCSKPSLNFTDHQKGEHRVLLIDGYQLTKRVRTIKEANSSLGGVLFE